ncbi:uncharacterized protein TNCV_2371191 [Trichonephila clavipes]|nr:uncharacterized protein TNCV_2371191 [Trichonephila clavipes]
MKNSEITVSESFISPCMKRNAFGHPVPGILISDEPQAMIKNKEEMVIKRKNESKEYAEFIFPRKTVSLVSPTSTQDPVETSNHLLDVQQDVGQPLPTDSQVTTEEAIPKPRLPLPIMLKIQLNFREQIKFLYDKLPHIRNKSPGDLIKIYAKEFEEYRSLIHAMAEDKKFEQYFINRKLDKPIKVVIKGLPISSKIEGIKNNLKKKKNP